MPFERQGINLKKLGRERGAHRAIVTLGVFFDRNVKHKDLSRIVQNVCKVTWRRLNYLTPENNIFKYFEFHRPVGTIRVSY